MQGFSSLASLKWIQLAKAGSRWSSPESVAAFGHKLRGTAKGVTLEHRVHGCTHQLLNHLLTHLAQHKPQQLAVNLQNNCRQMKQKLSHFESTICGIHNLPHTNLGSVRICSFLLRPCSCLSQQLRAISNISPFCTLW